MIPRPATALTRALLLAPLLSLLPAVAAAQATAVLRGEVRTEAGAAAAGARVTLADSAGRELASTVADGSGRFILLSLPAGGPYTLTASRAGDPVAVHTGVVLGAGDSRRLALVLGADPVALPGLRVGGAADATFTGTRTGAVTVVEERAIRSLPSLDRDIVGFAALSPLVAVEGGAISVAGQNARYNSLRIDGGLARDAFGLSPTGVPGGQANARPLPMDAVRQYSVLVSPFDVRQSGFTGGLLDATTRSGGERWETAVYGFWREGGWAGEPSDGGALDRGAVGEAGESRTAAAGFRVGGPVGRARVLAAGEVERRRRPLPGLHVGRVDPMALRLGPAEVDEVVSLLDEAYGFDAGHGDPHALDNPLGNLFLRLDAPVAGRHDVAVHYNLISAADDVGARHLGFGPYQLSSAGTRLESRTHGAQARVGTRVRDGTSHSLLLTAQHTRDRHLALSELPQVDVWVFSEAGDPGDGPVRRRVQAGGEPLAHDSDLSQTVIQASSSLSQALGSHLVTVGVEATRYGVRRRHLPASRGIWRFDSVEALAANEPSAYERLLLADGASAAVELAVLEVAAFVQDEWELGDGVSLTLGLRVDLPAPLGLPERNPVVEERTGVATDRRVASAPLFSPRVGFNWMPGTRWRTQVRGGVGLFTGSPPLAWLSEAWSGTGLRTGLLVCEGAATPSFTPHAPPAECAGGAVEPRRDLVLFADEFRYPQDLRASLGVDQELPLGMVASVEGVFSRAFHQVAIEDLNLGDPNTGPFPTSQGWGQGVGGRPAYGMPRLVPDRFGFLEPDPVWDDFGTVLLLGNRTRNAALAVAGELSRRFADRLDFRAAYTWTRSVDTGTLLYEDALRNYGLRAVRGLPGDPEARPSAYDRPHRVLGSVRARIGSRGGGLEAGLLYVGQSGLPYSYVYETDMNGDGLPGPGAAAELYNDLFYVPEIEAELPLGFVSNQMLMQLIARDDCLRSMTGSISARNECRAPWSNRLDLRLAQGIHLPGGRRALLTGDVVNLLNLLNGDWGLVHLVPPIVPIYRVDRRTGCPGIGCALGNSLVGTYTGPRRRNPETGGVQAALPFILSLPDSRWRAQIGLRIEL